MVLRKRVTLFILQTYFLTGMPEYDTKLRGMPAKVPEECAICGDFQFDYWGITHGRGYCTCGATYQLKPLGDDDWDDVPELMIKEEYVDELKEYYEENGTLDGFES